MRDVLVSDEERPVWSKRAKSVIAAMRESHAFLRDEDMPLVEEGSSIIKWWTFAGGRANRLLAGLLERRLGERVTAANEIVRFSAGAGASLVGVRAAVAELAEGPPLTWGDAAALVELDENARVSKVQPCLPDEMARELVAREIMDVVGAGLALGRPVVGGGRT